VSLSIDKRPRGVRLGFMGTYDTRGVADRNATVSATANPTLWSIMRNIQTRQGQDASNLTMWSAYMAPAANSALQSTNTAQSRPMNIYNGDLWTSAA
jgi:hypothetical protein